MVCRSGHQLGSTIYCNEHKQVGLINTLDQTVQALHSCNSWSEDVFILLTELLLRLFGLCCRNTTKFQSHRQLSHLMVNGLMFWKSNIIILFLSLFLPEPTLTGKCLLPLSMFFPLRLDPTVVVLLFYVHGKNI